MLPSTPADEPPIPFLPETAEPQRAEPTVAESLNLLLDQVGELRREFDAKIRFDEVRERQVESLHEELEAHRRGLYRSLLRPVLGDLIAMSDDLADVLRDAPAADDERAGRLVEAIGSFQDSVLETLLRNGVTTFTVEEDAFDRSRQKVIETVETTEPALDRTVASRLRPGFELDGVVLRPEWVSAYRHTPAPSDS